MIMVEDDVLVLRAQAGDGQAFTELVKNYHAFVYAIVSGVLDDLRDAEEVVQDTFINAYRGLAQLENPARFKGWLAEIARNCARDRLRKNKPETVPIDEVRSPSLETSDSADARLIQDEQRELVRRAMMTLSQKDREIARAYYLDGASYDELIRAHGLSYKAISFRLSRAKRILTKRLKHLLSGVFIPPATTLKKIGSEGLKVMKIGTVPKITVGVIAVIALALIGTRQLLSPEEGSAPSAKALAPADEATSPSVAEANAAHEEKAAGPSLETESQFSAEEMEQIERFFAELDAADVQSDETQPADTDEHGRIDSEVFDTDDAQSPEGVMKAYVEAYRNANFEAMLPLVTGTAKDGIESAFRLLGGEMPEEIIDGIIDHLPSGMSDEMVGKTVELIHELTLDPKHQEMRRETMQETMREMTSRVEIVNSEYVGDEFHFKLRMPIPELPEMPELPLGWELPEMPNLPEHIDTVYKMRKEHGEWLIYE